MTNYLNDPRISWRSSKHNEPVQRFNSFQKKQKKNLRESFDTCLRWLSVCLSVCRSRQHDPRATAKRMAEKKESVFYLTRQRLPSVLAELRAERRTQNTLTHIQRKKKKKVGCHGVCAQRAAPWERLFLPAEAARAEEGPRSSGCVHARRVCVCVAVAVFYEWCV